MNGMKPPGQTQEEWHRRLLAEQREQLETVYQLEEMLRLISIVSDEALSTFSPGIEAWLEEEFLPAAKPEWRAASRREQADMYIEWLKE
jgi:hypothetical protein